MTSIYFTSDTHFGHTRVLQPSIQAGGGPLSGMNYDVKGILVNKYKYMVDNTPAWGVMNKLLAMEQRASSVEDLATLAYASARAVMALHTVEGHIKDIGFRAIAKLQDKIAYPSPDGKPATQIERERDEYVQCKIEISCQDDLVAALMKLGIKRSQISFSDHGSVLVHTKRHKKDELMFVRRANGMSHTFQPVVAAWASKKYTAEWLNDLKTAYVEIHIRKHAKKSGFTVEKKKCGGKTVLTAYK